jgi:hypothetical protein
MSELCNLFYKYRSDKCPAIFHSYSPVYYDILKDKKNDFKHILEIGIGTNEIMQPISGPNYQIGSSLKAWRDFFCNSTVFGLDINQNVLFEEERIKCFFADQSKSESLEEAIFNINQFTKSTIEYDFILDDGSHVVEHMLLTFHTLKKYLKTGGIYIIEDIQLKDLNTFKQLEDKEYKIIYVHSGSSAWDSFVAFVKI